MAISLRHAQSDQFRHRIPAFDGAYRPAARVILHGMSIFRLGSVSLAARLQQRIRSSTDSRRSSAPNPPGSYRLSAVDCFENVDPVTQLLGDG